MMKKLFLKSNQLSLNNSSNNQLSPDKLSQKNIEKEPKLNNSFIENRNNITVDYSKNYAFLKSPIELPKISGTKKNYCLNKSKLSGIKHIMLSNSSKNIYSQNMMGMQNNSGNKFLRRDKTHSILIKEEDSDNDLTNDNINLNNISLNNIYKNNGDMALFRRKIKNNNNNNNKNINNITNINIHIHSNENQINNNIIYRNSNTQSLAKKKQNITSRDLANKHDTLTSNKNIFNSDNKTIETLSNINSNKNNILNNSNNSIMNNSSNNLLLQRNNNNNNNIKIRILKKKNFQKSQRLSPGHSSSVEGNAKGSALSIVGNIIINNNKMNSINKNTRSNSKETNNINNINNNKMIKNPLPEISLTKIEGINKKIIEDKYNLASSNKAKNNKTLIEVLEEYEEIDVLDLEKINETNEFLENLIEKKLDDFIIFLKILQTHIDIEILFNSLNIKKAGNKNNKSNNNNLNNNTLKQKMQLCINNEKQYKLFNLLINYFNFLSEIYTYNYILRLKYLQKEDQKDLCFFLYQILNNLFKNAIKSQICLYSSIFISLSHLAIFDFNLIIKNYFFKIFKEISYSLYNTFEFFIRQELQKNYTNLIETNLRPDFFENYEKIIKEHKINELNNREIIRLIMNNVQKSVNSLKFYSSSNLKYSLIKPYGDALNQLLFSFDRKSLVHFVEIFLKTILYEQLEANKKNNSPKSDILFSKRNNNNENCGSGVVNNIKESPPYLPEINPKLKYTLVLDIDETIIHYFFTYINGMFFVRPFVYEFLNELKDYYEIVTFTAGTKDYADNILNLVDSNDNLIKYRLYRHHTTIMGCNVFKDLMRLGRDMSKIIIIDNLKDNFKLQPNNGLFIKTWTSDINDNQLFDLQKILRDIALFNVEDVRPVIEKINDYIKISRNMINPYSNIDIRKILEITSKNNSIE